MRVVIGHSDEVDGRDAIRAVLAECEAQLGGDRPVAAMLFASVDYDHAAILAAIDAQWPGLPLVGGSGDGEMSSRAGFAMDSVLLTVFCGADLTAWVGLGRDLAADPAGAVRAATACLGDAPRPAVALTTFAPSTDASAVIARINAAIDDPRCPLLGGLTGDHREYGRMVEFCGREVLQDSLPILFLAGDLQVSWGIGSGWFPIGPAGRVTKSEGHLVHEIDNEPAVEVYRRYYGVVASGSLGEHPLAVYLGNADGPWCLRAVLGIDEATGSVRFAGAVPVGCHVRMTAVLSEGLLTGSRESVERAVEQRRQTAPSVALVFTCAARKWVLGSQAVEEYATTRASLDATARDGVPIAGLYVFGEIAPQGLDGTAVLHNESCVTVLLGSHVD